MANFIASALFGQLGSTMVTFHDTMKTCLLRPAATGTLKFDIGTMQKTLAAQGVKMTLDQIRDVILRYCDIVKEKNADRVLDMTVERSSDPMLVTFTVLFFDPKSLLVIDEKLATPLVGTSNAVAMG